MKKLELLHPAHTKHSHGKSPTRAPSKDKAIEDPQNQIQLMKQNQKECDTQEQLKHTKIRKNILNQKKIQVFSAAGGHTQTDINLLKLLKFVQETMHFQTTASNYKQRT